MATKHLVTFDVVGHPATFATRREDAWRQAVADAVARSGCQPPQDARFVVRIDFRLGVSLTKNDVWDLDNLVKPTLDAMAGVFGARQWQGHPQAADDRVDRIIAQKRLPNEGEVPGATIEVWTTDSPPEPFTISSFDGDDNLSS